MYDHKSIFILGMARSGYEVAKLLSKHNCKILITDREEQDSNQVLELESLGIKYITSTNQEELLNNSFDYVVKNPGIKIDHPVCIKAKDLNIPIINELEVAYHYLNEGVKIIGITGSNGKTTTTTLVYEILKEAKLPVHLGGNIGFPMSAFINKINKNELFVLEISAQQLHDFIDFKVDIAILTNLTEVHLDHFKTYDYYKQIKKKIFDNNQISIINKDDNDSLLLTDDINNKKYFSIKDKTDMYLYNDAIYYLDQKIIYVSDIKIKGNHNYQNIMCAILVAKEFNVNNEIIVKALKKFTGVEHRLEFVRNLNERKFYNDSKSTNVKSTQIALSAFDKPTILLLGGLDRNHPFDDLLPYLNKTKMIICYGETKERIQEFSLKNNIECHVLNTLEDAINKAYDLSDKGDIILLSPACASWDQYKDFEQRGQEFKRVVNDLR